MVKIRLTRIGAKGQPYYRVVVVDSHRKRDGAVIEKIGSYNPRTEPSSFEIDKDRLSYWRGVGAQLTEPVLVLLGEAKPKYHQPKNKKEEVVTPPITKDAPAENTKVEETSADEALSAPEDAPVPSPELAEVIQANEQVSPQATSEEIAQTIENTEENSGQVEEAIEKEPTSQDENSETAEITEENDSEIESKP